jgi:FkbM family methyltransferase
LRPRIRQLAESAILVFNVPLMAAFVQISFRLLSRLTGVKGADYSYDRSERVWVARSHSTYIAVGFRVARLWPMLMHRYVEEKLAESRDSWYLHNFEPPAGSVIVDVGAGNGTDTVLFAQSAGPAGWVFAIEAHPKTARLLRATCKYNKFNNVTIVEAALMGSTEKLRMTDEGSHLANRVLRESGAVEGVVTDMVDTTTLDRFCLTHKISCIDFLKMNIEGAEVEAIKGMTISIAKIRRACIACHDFIKQDPDEPIKRSIAAFMKSNGFEIQFRNDDERPWVRGYIYCERPSQSFESEKALQYEGESGKAY